MGIVDKEMWRQPDEHEVGHTCQNGWVKELKELPVVHPDHEENVGIAFFTGICFLLVLIVLVLLLGNFLPQL